MVVKDRSTKDLVIPRSLGNFNNNGGGEGGGVTPEQAAQIASAVTESAISAYDTELQAELGGMNEAISANTQSIEDLSGLSADVEAVSAQTSANTQSIENLSAATSANTEAIVALSGVPDDIAAISAQTTATTAAVEALSGVPAEIETLSAATTANTEAIETLSGVTGQLETAVGGKQDALTAGSGISISGATISVKAGDGLGFSGDTLVVSGGTGGETPYYIINDVISGSQADRVAFYNEMLPAFSGATSESPKNANIYYRFVVGDPSNPNSWNMAMLSNVYIGGSAEITLIFEGYPYNTAFGNQLPNIFLVSIYSDGTYETYYWGGNQIPSINTTCVYVGPQGDFWEHRSAECLYDEGEQFKLAVKGCEGDFSAEYGFGSIVYARKVTVGNVTTYTWSLIVPTDTGVMKGVWHSTDLNDVSSYVLDSWTAV